MKFIIDNWYLFLVALASGSMLLWPVLQNASGGSLTPARAVQLINREKRWSSTCAKPRNLPPAT